jgi:2-keto-4-pentenoate hydratase/2-oxohepta-3-ene-1,7-dioic acid hydratase in catechol pathway
VQTAEGVIDLNLAQPQVPPDLAAALAAGLDLKAAATAALATTAPRHRIESLALAPVIPRPGKVICLGLNYFEHAKEGGRQKPEYPWFFMRSATSLVAHGAKAWCPKASDKLDYEAELAVVIGKRSKGVEVEKAFESVLGYMNLNDVSARDFQFSDGQWQRGKACDTFAPMGPYIVTKDEIADPHKLRVQCRVNGRTLQDSTTEQLVFGVDALVSFLSQTVTLEPGDVIATGTPPGVGFARKPPIFLQDGDVVEIEVEGLGILSNPVSK